MSDPVSNYVQLKVPIENADLVFEALCAIGGAQTTETDDEGNVTELDKETCARKVLIRYIENSVIEYQNRQAIKAAEDARTDLNIT